MGKLCDLFPWLCPSDVEMTLIQVVVGLVAIVGIPAFILWKGTQR